MQAIPKIITGKRAKLRLPKIVEWIRHSSFIIQVKSLNIATLPHEREEEFVKMPVVLSEFCDPAGMEKFSLVEDCEPGADLFCYLEDMGGDEDGIAVLYVLGKVVFDFPLHDRIKINEWFIDQGKGRAVDECLREHEFLASSS